MTTAVWFDGWSSADPVDPAYPLRAFARETPAGDEAAVRDAADHAIVARICAGDDEAFATLYREHAAGLLGYAYRLCGARAIAQDVVADLFVHLWDRRETWQPRGSVRAYLYLAVRHRIANYVRDERRASVRAERVTAEWVEAAEEMTDDMTTGAPEPDERLAMVWRVVDTFPPLRRQVMYLRWARGLMPEEIATVLQLNRNAVDQHLSRAMRAIREAVPHLIHEGETGP